LFNDPATVLDKKPSLQRILRRLLDLSCFPVKVFHIAGSTNWLADWFSRPADDAAPVPVAAEVLPYSFLLQSGFSYMCAVKSVSSDPVC
jgi:hypothetical protein